MIQGMPNMLANTASIEDLPSLAIVFSRKSFNEMHELLKRRMACSPRVIQMFSRLNPPHHMPSVSGRRGYKTG